MPRTTAELALEEQVHRDPYAVEPWLSYTKHLSSKSDQIGALLCIYERAVAALPGSYKLWRQYTHAFRAYAKTFHPAHPARSAALQVTSHAALALRVSPVLWVEYIRLASDEARWTETRRAVNDALRALPVLQHDMIWELVLQHVACADGVPPRLVVLLLRRFAKLRPGSGRERLYRWYVQAELWDDAVAELCNALSDPDWVPEGKKSREQLWMELARVAARHPNDIFSTDVPTLLRGGIKHALTDVGELWVVFGEYFIRKGLFEDARNVYEEAVTTVTTVRDFAVVFDAYAKFEESLTAAAIEDVDAIKEELKEDGHDEEQSRDLKEATEIVELLIARLEYLTNRRPMLLSDVWLRQNPHNVHEWHKRARMFKQAKNAPNVVDTYTKAVQTVDPWRATNGRPHTLWLAFARYYEDEKELASSRQVLDKAVSDPEQFRSAEDLAAVWCEYAEMELRSNTAEAALAILVRATTEPNKRKREEAEERRGKSKSNMAAVVGAGAGNKAISHEYDTSSPAWNAYKSMRVWHFLIDLSQSISTADDVISVYHKMFQLRIATAQTVLQGAAYLESKRLFEQAFRLYDRGASAIPWPAALQVWVVYLTKFMKRFGSRKLERARDLFEEAIRSAPSTRKAGRSYPHPELRLLYIMYANMEEKHSLARHALKVLDRASKAVQEEDQAAMYRLYIVKMATLFGVTKTRPIYEEAMSELRRTEEVLEFSIRYAGMETRVGEIDRARAVYQHACRIADPRRRGFYEIFWRDWNDFELEYGTEDTFRDMLREKRRVQLDHKGVILDQNMLLGTGLNGEKGVIQSMVKDDEASQDVSKGAVGIVGDGVVDLVNGKENGGGDEVNGTAVVNSEEIDLDLPEDADEDENGGEKTAENGNADEEAGAAKGEEGDKDDRKLKIVEKELPESIRRLVSDAHRHAQQDGAENLGDRAQEDGGADDGNEGAAVNSNGEAKRKVEEDGDDRGRTLGALQRFKRRKKEAG